jgi:hypothetical protein
MSNCICDDEILTHEITCVICKENKTALMQKRDRWQNCDVHKQDMICGRYEPVCDECDKLGWYSTKGFGGPHEHRNRITNERRKVSRK